MLHMETKKKLLLSTMQRAIFRLTQKVTVRERERERKENKTVPTSKTCRSVMWFGAGVWMHFRQFYCSP